MEGKAAKKAALLETIKDTYEDIMNLKFLEPDEFALCGECEYCCLFNHSHS